MKFAFVFDGLGCGGIERVGIDYCNALVERGHDVTVINLVPETNEFVKQLSDRVVYTTKNFSRSLAPERYSTLVSRAAWGRFAYPIAYTACMIAMLAKKPFLQCGLGEFDVAVAFSGHYNDLSFVALGCVRAQEKLAWLHGTINGYALIGDGYLNLYKHFDKLICLSDEGIEEFKDAKHWLNLSIFKLYNPIDLNNSNCSKERVSELRRTYGDFILMIARLAPPKDFKTLINAVAILKDKYGIERNCLIVGGGPDEDKIIEYIASSTVSNLIHMIGYDSNPSPYYEACGVFVLSSLNEGLPTVLLEAMAHGTPVVSTNVPGAREILEGGKDGFLCGVGNPENMADCIFQLYKSTAIAEQYSKQGLIRVNAFEKDAIINRFFSILNGSADRL